MVILEDLHNQRSNQFIQFIHFSAFCKKHNIDFYHPPFIKRYTNIYPELKLYQKAYNTRFYLWIMSKIKRRSKSLMIDLNDDIQAESYAKNVDIFRENYVFCRGGRLRDNRSVIEYRNYFKHVFNPNIDKDKLNNIFLNKEFEDQKIIGVHVRRTDYINYEGGMYFFSDDIYINYIKQIIGLMERSCKIILFTDDKNIDFDRYKMEFNHITLSKNSIVEDYYLMGQCDYLLSTNSTFTLVASYLGKCKLHRFMGPYEKIADMSIFKECTTLNHTDEEAQRADIAREEYRKSKFQ